MSGRERRPASGAEWEALLQRVKAKLEAGARITDLTWLEVSALQWNVARWAVR